MEPAHDRRQRQTQTSDRSGGHSLEFVIRHGLEIQRDIGTPGATEFLQSQGVKQQVISRVLAPDARIRAADRRALDSPVVVADLPIAPRSPSWPPTAE